ncbi:MAG: alpha/beta hydrolase [Leptolinea sp.]|nr:alpha/beta hydrolase [Leptolinea sp.]
MSRRRFALNGETILLDEDERAAIPGSFVKLSDGQTWYQLAGPVEGKPVIFLNGYSVPHYLWDHTFHPLAEAGFRVLRFDHFGRGWSDRPRVEFGPDLFDRQIIDLLSALEIKTPVNLVGSSMGGIVAGIFADRHPELVDRLVLIDPAGMMIPPAFPKSLLLIPLLGELILHLTGDRTLPAGMAEDLLYPERFPQYVADYLPQMRIAGFKRAILSTFRSGILFEQRSVYERQGKTNIPILLLWGRHDRTIPLEVGDKVHALLPHADWRVIEDAGHVPHYERPEVVNPMLVEFLQ